MSTLRKPRTMVDVGLVFAQSARHKIVDLFLRDLAHRGFVRHFHAVRMAFQFGDGVNYARR